MPDIADGDSVDVQGSAAAPYQLKNVGGVYSCSCPAWRNAGGPIDRRTCKHLKQYRGDQAEIERVGDAAKAGKPTKQLSAGGEDESAASSAPPVLLAHKWENDQDLVGWWMSEKLDGVRAWWDGHQFLSRLGNAFLAPAWFTKDLPGHPLDGELWVGRQEFQKCVSIVRRADAGDEWKQVKYLIFDAPALVGGFEGRVAYVNKLFGGGQSEWAAPVEHVLCQGYDHLKQELARVEGLGGEGLMMRQPGSTYAAGRSTTLLKVKTFHDAEGRVLAHEGGRGKHKGRLGALVVEMLDGTRFNVGTGFTDKEREEPPQVGDIITYRYQELTKDGVPRFPSYVGLAIDKSGPTATSKPAPKPAAKAPASPGPGAPLAAPPVTSAPAPAPVVAKGAVVAKWAGPAPDELDAGASIHGVVRALSAAWRGKRWSEAEAALHEQATFVKVDGTRVEGRAACVQSHRAFLEENRVLRLSENDHKVDVWGATAMASCRWEMTYAAGGKPQRAKGSETMTLAYSDGSWRVVWRRIEMLAPPPRPAREESSEGPDSEEGHTGADDEDDS